MSPVCFLIPFKHSLLCARKSNFVFQSLFGIRESTEEGGKFDRETRVYILLKFKSVFRSFCFMESFLFFFYSAATIHSGVAAVLVAFQRARQRMMAAREQFAKT